MICKLCEKTHIEEGELCDRCWELDSRIQNDLRLAKKIINRIDSSEKMKQECAKTIKCAVCNYEQGFSLQEDGQSIMEVGDENFFTVELKKSYWGDLLYILACPKCSTLQMQKYEYE